MTVSHSVFAWLVSLHPSILNFQFAVSDFLFETNLIFFYCRFMRKIQDLMMRNVQLILFFDVFNLIKTAKYFKHDLDLDSSTEVYETAINETKGTEQEVQTDLHPIPYCKDEYVWNLWDFRRKAIQLVRLDVLKKFSTLLKIYRLTFVLRRLLQLKPIFRTINCRLQIKNIKTLKKVCKQTAARKSTRNKFQF